jgi:hypothetical protein
MYICLQYRNNETQLEPYEQGQLIRDAEAGALDLQRYLESLFDGTARQQVLRAESTRCTCATEEAAGAALPELAAAAAVPLAVGAGIGAAQYGVKELDEVLFGSSASAPVAPTFNTVSRGYLPPTFNTVSRGYLPPKPSPQNACQSGERRLAGGTCAAPSSGYGAPVDWTSQPDAQSAWRTRLLPNHRRCPLCTTTITKSTRNAPSLSRTHHPSATLFTTGRRISTVRSLCSEHRVGDGSGLLSGLLGNPIPPAFVIR